MSNGYKIGVAIAMSSNHNAVLSALSAGLLNVHTSVNNLTGNFNRLKTAIGGALAVTAGVAMFEMMASLIKQTADYSHELAKLQTLGGDMAKNVENGTVPKAAMAIANNMKVPVKVTEVASLMGAMNSLLGYDDAMKIAPKMAEFSQTMAAQKDYKGDPKEDISKFLRAGELGGRLTDPTTHKAALDELERFLDLSQKIMAATHGMVTPSTLLGMTQQAGFSMRGMSDEGFMQQAVVAQAMGGQKSGTALLSLYQQMGGGKMTAAAAKNAQDLGLMNEGDWKQNKGGGVTVNADVQRRLGKLVSENPMNLVKELLKNLEARGITDHAEQNRLVMGALSRQTSQRYIGEMMMNKDQMEAEINRMREAAGSSQANKIFADKSVETNIKGLEAAWYNLQVAMTGPNSENSIRLLQAMTEKLKYLTGVIGEMNPETISNVGKAIGVIAAAFVGVGIAMLVAAAGPIGLIVGAIVGLAAAVAFYLPQIKQFFDLTKSFDSKSAVPSVGGGPSGETAPEMRKRMYGRDKNVIPQSFEPSTATPKATPISLSLNIDGRTLAQSVSEGIQLINNFATSAPAADNRQMWRENAI